MPGAPRVVCSRVALFPRAGRQTLGVRAQREAPTARAVLIPPVERAIVCGLACVNAHARAAVLPRVRGVTLVRTIAAVVRLLAATIAVRPRDVAPSRQSRA